MTTKEIAILRGVVIPETCIELNWRWQTNLCWVKNNENEFIVIEASDREYWVCNEKDVCINAPQMHEIVSRLPSKLRFNNEMMYLDLLSAPYHNQSCFFLQYTGGESKKDYFTSMRIDDFHFAEAYAQLYIKLKKENLLDEQKIS